MPVWVGVGVAICSFMVVLVSGGAQRILQSIWKYLKRKAKNALYGVVQMIKDVDVIYYSMTVKKGSTEDITLDDEVPDDVLPGQEYEIFLSFRGPDTRTTFTDHLYRRLIDANIMAYKDNEELRKGEEIEPKLLQAINRAAIAIPIFSKRYAESKWCLKELVQIVKCRRSRGMKVMPIFYNVTPSEVRNQTKNYKRAFKIHKKSYDDTTVREWKEALDEIGALSGWEIPSDTYRREGKLIEDVTKEMSCALKKAYLKMPDHLVGLSHHVERIQEMLSLETHGLRIIGIHGMGGIGKTTLAKFVYNHLIPNFECSSFLVDTRSKDIESLQKGLMSDLLTRKSTDSIDKGVVTLAKRFSNKKVLIVLDDVDKKTQIEDLIGEQDKQDWFGQGTRIIMTTRDRDVLRRAHVHDSYELREMDSGHSLQLFCRHAFRSDTPKRDLAILSKQIIQRTCGLPLALEVIGFSLRGKSKEEWQSKLEKLKDVPPDKVSQKLRISYDELDDRQKHIFLDVASFFIGHDQRVAIYFWDPQLHPKDALNVLQQKSLVKIRDNRFWMHDQLRNLGREIIRKDNITKPERQTRLCDKEVATKVFMTKKETENIQGLCVEVNEKSYPYFTEEEFAKLSKVRLFWVEKKHHFNYLNWSSSAVSSNSHIFSGLRWLRWPRFPHMCIETSNFFLLDLAILDLSYSSFKIDWDGWSHIKRAKNLKVLNLTGCKNLERTPDFSSHLLLERLILKECSSLVEIDKSIGMLGHLVHLDLRFCQRLCKLPTELSCVESLTELLIDHTSIIKIPHWLGMENLEVFSAYGCRLLKTCNSFNNLTSLRKLSLSDSPITSIPDSIGELSSLSELCLFSCKFLKKLPESIGGLMSLIELDISWSGIEELPNSIGCLKSLKQLRMSRTPIRELPTTIGMAGKLQEIDASDCSFLRGLPILPRSLINLTVSSDSMQTIPTLSSLINLKLLRVRLSFKHMPPTGQESPVLCWTQRLGEPERLRLEGFDLPKSIPKLPSSITQLRIFSCRSLETLSDLSHLKKLSTLDIVGAPLIELEGLHNMESLHELRISSCLISEIDGLSENLRILKISNCEKLKRLSRLSNCKKLIEFSLTKCPNLVEILGRLESMESLHIQDCKSLEKIPDVLNVKTLSSFSIRRCPKLCKSTLDLRGPISTNDFCNARREAKNSNEDMWLRSYHVWQ